MPSLVREKDLQTVLKLPFCYFCGKTFSSTDVKNKDHVPPKSCFAYQDRSPPLILSTHVVCNNSQNVSDEAVGQFLSLKHRRIPSKKNRRLKFTRYTQNGTEFAALTNVNMYGAIERWVRAFHAALYHEPCPPETKFGIQTPFPVATPSATGGIETDKVRQQHFLFVKKIKDNRAAKNLDRIASNNGKVRYECVWEMATNGIWICIFALDIYSWMDLGDINNFPARGCTGFYQLPTGLVPEHGTQATTLRIELPNYDPADPFGR